MALFEPHEDRLSVDTLVVGGGIAGMTAAIESAEAGREVVLVEKLPSLGGRVMTFTQYFPKLCPPACGVEINLKRLRQTEKVRVLTLSEVSAIDGEPGDYTVTVTLNPRYINERCTACGACEKVCDIERADDFNYGMSTTKAVYLPHMMAYPMRYVVDADYAQDPAMKKCADACEYDAFDLAMEARTITVKAKALVWATGWRPYDATKLDNLAFGTAKNVITNVMMERLAAPAGPTQGKITRPSDQKEITKIGFVQCAGSRDENHLKYCSAICCLASMKQATYIRERYPEAEVHLFYIDVRSPGRFEDFYTKMQEDEKFFFHRGKVGKITEDRATGNVTLHAENTLTGSIEQVEVDMAVLATGMVPNTADVKPPVDVPLDEFGFLLPDGHPGVIGTASALRPCDVASSIQDATGAAMKAMTVEARR